MTLKAEEDKGKRLMKTSRNIHAVDSHTMGEPTRIVIGGIPKIAGDSMAEKKQHLEQNMDNIRTVAEFSDVKQSHKT